MPAYSVHIVDGGFIRNTIDDDFALGGNPGRYAYIPDSPNRELWIEDTGDYGDMAAIALHEMVECGLMMDEGLDYSDAHDEANISEKALRKSLVDGSVKVKDTSDIMAILSQHMSPEKGEEEESEDGQRRSEEPA